MANPQIFLIFFLLLFRADLVSAKSWKEAGDRAMTVRLGISANSGGINLTNEDNSLRILQYKPNAPTATFVSASYDWLGVRLSAVNPLSNEDDRLKGKTTGEDWQFRFHFEKISLEFFYQTYQGFYVENSDLFQPMVPGTAYLQNPELKIEQFGGSYLVNINPDDFSMSAAMDLTAQQLTSGWAWLLGMSLHGGRFTADQGLVPPLAVGNFGEVENVRSGRLYSLLGGGGVGGTYVPFERYFLSGSVILMAGPEFQSVDKIDGSSTQGSVLSSKSQFKVGMGYCGDKFISGLTLQGDVASFSVANARIAFNILQSAVFIGTRFDL